MKIQILGTAAAEAWPAIFCNCDTCQKVRKAKGKDIRSRSSILIDSKYIIDFGPDSYYHSIKYGLDFSELRDVFITHSHSDHFTPTEFEFVCPPFAHNLKEGFITLHGNRHVLDLMKNVVILDKNLLKYDVVESFKSVVLDTGYTFIPVKASHGNPEEDTVNYIIEKDNKRFLFICDSGWYGKETLDFIKKFTFDCIISECTCGWLDMEPIGHMTYPAVINLKNILINSNSIKENTPFYITHFSHNVGMLHNEMESIACKDNITIAYDGITIDI